MKTELELQLKGTRAAHSLAFRLMKTNKISAHTSLSSQDKNINYFYRMQLASVHYAPIIQQLLQGYLSKAFLN